MNKEEFRTLAYFLLGVLWGGVALGSVSIGYAGGISIGLLILWIYRRLDNLWSF